MTINNTERRDSWSSQDDTILANTILDHVQSGSTQLKAFEEAAEKLNRTSAACGFRWNSEVRKKYEDLLRKAKLNSKKLKQKSLSRSIPDLIKQNSTENENIAIPAVFDSPLMVIQQLAKTAQENMTEAFKKINELESELRKKDEEIKELRGQLNSTPKTETEDFQALMDIMSRAREMGILTSDKSEKII